MMKSQIIRYAADRYIALTPNEIERSADGFTIDGMNAREWVDMMSAD